MTRHPDSFPQSVLLLAVVWQYAGFSVSGIAADERVDFERDIQPLLVSRCLECHGPEVQESHFRLDRKSTVLRGGDSGEPAVIPGQSEQSHLIQLISGTIAGQVMPPDESKRLSSFEIELFRKWIDQGAEWSGPDAPEDSEASRSSHWAFQPVPDFSSGAATGPSGNSAGWGHHQLDSFILKALRERSLEPNPPAGRSELIRRMYLDVLGLPPTPEAVQAFVSDPAPEATERLIESVLSSPHYGERWASYWLDLIRFSETNGFETNRERPNAWPFRDYVIRSLNTDKPYDQFIREQIAGDACGVPEGTGFLVAGPYDLVKSPDISLTLMQRQNELDDMISATGTVFLGLTFGCARCHNHKFDPIRQSEYYALQAVFSGVQHGDRQLPLTDDRRQELAELDAAQRLLLAELNPFVKKGSGTRSAVSALGNEESFAPIAAKYLRMMIEESSSGEPCIDELEVFSGSKNVALSTAGAKVSVSGTLPGYEIHRAEHLNDGRGGNSRSWISNEPGQGWVRIEFSGIPAITSIQWGRDREGRFGDRLATKYRFEVSQDGEHWTLVASSADRVPKTEGSRNLPEYDLTGLPAGEADRGRSLITRLDDVRAKRAAVAAASVVYAGTFTQPGPTHRLFRGEPMSPRELVQPGTVSALGNLHLTESTPEQQRRVALAEWIASKENPLTARVIVNRLWQYHFGKGLVTTPSDFGAARVRPTHPELLDWLAREFMDHNWSLKHIHRMILSSATWQQSSQPRPDALRVDGGTELWWRFPPRRLDAEVIRDSILTVSGVLDRRMFGPGFSGFEVEMENVRHYFPKKDYGPQDWRRMVYMTRVRLEKESVFGIFDCPDGASSVPRRSRSTTPLQAFNLFNSPFMLQQASLLADRLRKEAGTDGDAATVRQIERAFWLCSGRSCSAQEKTTSIRFIQRVGLEAFCRAMLNSSEMAFLQ